MTSQKIFEQRESSCAGQDAAQLLFGGALIWPLWKASVIESEVCCFCEIMDWNSKLYLAMRNL